MDIDDEDLYGPDAFDTPTATTTKESVKPEKASEEQNEAGKEEDMEDVYEDDDLV